MSESSQIAYTNHPLNKKLKPELHRDGSSNTTQPANSQPPRCPTLPNLLEFGVRWPHAKQAGLLLDRLLTQEKLFDVFTSWNRPTGGYRVPAGHAQYAGVSFTRDHLIEAAGLGSSSSAGTAAVFSSRELNRAPKAKAWYESGGSVAATSDFGLR
ncbi:hypothetical protein B0H13DRAFT_1851905 [Mycena leptocephala]|nr:hypothetical protein B0H13DRAFT_1851905 [Mycena leptocephala]